MRAFLQSRLVLALHRGCPAGDGTSAQKPVLTENIDEPGRNPFQMTKQVLSVRPQVAHLFPPATTIDV